MLAGNLFRILPRIAAYSSGSTALLMKAHRSLFTDGIGIHTNVTIRMSTSAIPTEKIV